MKRNSIKVYFLYKGSKVRVVQTQKTQIGLFNLAFKNVLTQAFHTKQKSLNKKLSIKFFEMSFNSLI